MEKIKRTKLLDRQQDRRDAKLFIVATEGKETEKQYFRIFNSSRIKVEILATTEDGKSSPEYVLERLDIFKERYDLDEDDMLWLVSDVDRWGAKKLSSVCSQARQKGYNLAISNPCFEVWLTLHFEELNTQDRTCDNFKARLRTILGSYNGSNLDISAYQQNIENAVNRAKNLHQISQQDWPPTLGTHVYRLVEILLESLDKDL
ncbi:MULTISPECIES: RloB family protein [unclassified Microcoleus]|uniref:RloB family protein n=1 Tax=unclassified Microcoleus TaxID=2642155 RepID=UPI0025E871A4|nr:MULTISPECIES: RloB family protein [unclassified Microcoleus]